MTTLSRIPIPLVLALACHGALARADGWEFGLQAGFTKVALDGYDPINGTGPAVRAEAGYGVRHGIGFVAYAGYGHATSTEWLDPGEGNYAIDQYELGGDLELRASRLTFAAGGGLVIQHESFSYDDGEGNASAGTRSQLGPLGELRVGVDVVRAAHWSAQIVVALKQMKVRGTRAPATNYDDEVVYPRTTESGTESTLAVGLTWR